LLLVCASRSYETLILDAAAGIVDHGIQTVEMAVVVIESSTSNNEMNVAAVAHIDVDPGESANPMSVISEEIGISAEITVYVPAIAYADPRTGHAGEPMHMSFCYLGAARKLMGMPGKIWISGHYVTSPMEYTA